MEWEVARPRPLPCLPGRAFLSERRRTTIANTTTDWLAVILDAGVAVQESTREEQEQPRDREPGRR
jgi:hypothetical protein